MSQNEEHNPNPNPNPNPDPEAVPATKIQKPVRNRRCLIAIGVVIFLILLLFLVLLILALTVLKVRQPRAQLVSATLDGVSPRLSFPVLKVELNITLNLEVLVENRNHASFRHGTGQSILLYQGEQVGDMDIYPGNIPAMGSTTFPTRLTLQVEKFTSQMPSLIRDILAGELAMDIHTRLPGKVRFLGFIRKHIVAISNCHIVLGVTQMKVQSQKCKQKAKL